MIIMDNLTFSERYDVDLSDDWSREVSLESAYIALPNSFRTKSLCMKAMVSNKVHSQRIHIVAKCNMHWQWPSFYVF